MNPNPAQYGGSFQQAPQQPQQKGCVGRHWKWMLPVGCLGLLLGAAALVGGIVFVAMSAVRSSEVYQGALKVAQTHPAAVEKLGEPIKDGWLVQGNINFEGGSGNANFDVPVSGPKNSGTLRVSAVNPGGAWMYQRLDLVVNGETVSLLDRNVALPQGSPAGVETEEGDTGEDEGASAPADEADNSNANLRPVPSFPAGVLDEKALSKPDPPYPPLAKAARASGRVVVHVAVDESGRVVAANVVSGHPLLQQAAVQAARQARFAPLIQGGKPVRFDGTLSYDFVLEQ